MVWYGKTYSTTTLLLFGERKFFIVISFKEKNHTMEYTTKWFIHKCIIFSCFLKTNFKMTLKNIRTVLFSVVSRLWDNCYGFNFSVEERERGGGSTKLQNSSVLFNCMMLKVIPKSWLYENLSSSEQSLFLIFYVGCLALKFVLHNFLRLT